MMPRKKRKTLAIVISVAIILIIAIVGILLYLNTDMFKSNQTLFLKYIGKNTENVKDIEKVFDNTDYNNFLQTNKYTEKSEIKINYTEGLGTTLENTDNNINKLELTIDGQTDKANKYDYKNIKLLNDQNQLMGIEYIQNDNNYGIRFSDLFKQFLLVKNENLKDFFKKLGYTDEQLENISDTIEIENNNFDNFKFTEEIESLKEKYLNIINQNFAKDKFKKQSNQTIEINQKNIVANEYTLQLTKEELNNFYVKILENIKQDDIILGKIDKLQEKYIKTSDNTTNLKEQIVEEIEETIQNINENNIGNDQTKIIVYENNGQTLRTTVQGVDYEINFDYLQSGKEKFAEISYEKEEKKKVTLIEKEGETNLSIEYNQDSEPVKMEFSQQKNIEEDSCNKNISLKYEDQSNRVDANFVQEINKTDDFEKVELNNQNSIQLDELDETQLTEILNKVSEVVKNKLDKVAQEIKVEDIQEMLETLGIIREQQITAGENVTEAEKNRFNSKFEFYQGENISGENVKKMITTIEDYIINMQAVSNEELKIEISSSQKNEQLVEKLTEFFEENKNKEYNIKVEYDDSGLVKYIVLDIVQNKS